MAANNSVPRSAYQQEGKHERDPLDSFHPRCFCCVRDHRRVGKQGAGVFFGLEWLRWSTSGAFSATAFIIVGIKVAPSKSNAVKWVLISIIMILGLVSAVGAFIGDNPVSSLAGIAMFLVAGGFIKMDASEIASNENTPEQ